VNLVLLGAPGSGKGTQSSKLMDKGYKHISTGNLLRSEVAAGSDLGLKVAKILEEGQLVSDDVVVELLKANLDLLDNKYIFDGYPRNVEQSKTLTSLLEGSEFKAIFFDLNVDVLVDRLASRRTTKDGEHIYNVVSNPPKVEGICDVTGEKLIQRDDDKEEIVRKRLKVYKETMQSVLDYYESLGCLHRVDANRDLDVVFKDVISII
jgi:adenylate kinase